MIPKHPFWADGIIRGRWNLKQLLGTSTKIIFRRWEDKNDNDMMKIVRVKLPAEANNMGLLDSLHRSLTTHNNLPTLPPEGQVWSICYGFKAWSVLRLVISLLFSISGYVPLCHYGIRLHFYTFCISLILRRHNNTISVSISTSQNIEYHNVFTNQYIGMAVFKIIKWYTHASNNHMIKPRTGKGKKNINKSIKNKPCA